MAPFVDGRPDTIVPQPGNPQALNRYSYVLNNPLRYTDPTGMFSEDQIMASLTDQYGAEEARRIWNLWLLDAAWMNALYEADFGSRIWASQLGFGYFDQASEGSPRIVIYMEDIARPNRPVDLWHFQGRGGYQVSSQTNVVRETSCHVGACVQPIFEYDAQGRIVGGEPVRWQGSGWVQSLFGINPFWWNENSTAVRAPWRFTESYVEESFGTVLGWAVPEIDLAQDVSGIIGPLFPLIVYHLPGQGDLQVAMRFGYIDLPREFRP